MNRPATTLTALLAHAEEPLRVFLEHRILPSWLPQRRWFRAKSRPLRAVAFEAVFPCGPDDDGDGAVLAILRVAFADGDAPERYLLPLALVAPGAPATGDLPEAAVLGPVTTPAGERLLVDACWLAAFRQAFAERFRGDRGTDGSKGGDGGGTLRGRPAVGLPDDALRQAARLPSRVLGAEQSNTAFVYEGGAAGAEIPGMFVKLYRRLEPGIHPEPEMLRFLRERTGYRGVPAFLAALEWTPAGGASDENRRATIALAQELVSGGADAWTLVVEALAAAGGGAAPAALTALAARLGTAVGALHAALGSRADDPGFAPVPLAAADIAARRATVRDDLRAALAALAAAPALPPGVAARARDLAARGGFPEGTDGGAEDDTAGRAVRIHGDLHLGQILVAGDAVRILDFEGEPGRPLAAARRRESPLRDVAGMLRSFHYAAHVAARDAAARATDLADAQAAALAAAFLGAYFAVPGLAPLLPRGDAARRALVRLFTIEKAVYELRYELDNRPDWVSIPLQGLVSLCNESV